LSRVTSPAGSELPAMHPTGMRFSKKPCGSGGVTVCTAASSNSDKLIDAVWSVEF
jgi:hypothetical protein